MGQTTSKTMTTVSAVQPNHPSSCYGRRYGQRAACETCEEAPWCREAGELPLLTGQTEGANGEDLAYEIAQNSEDHAAPGRTQAPDDQLSAPEEVLARAMAMLVAACGGRPDRIACAILRLGGYSYSEIGRRLVRRKSKVAVAKDLQAIALADPALGALLKKRFAQALAFRTSGDPLVVRYLDLRAGMSLADWRRLNGWSVLADEFGLSRESVRCRIRRRLTRASLVCRQGASSSSAST